MQGQEGCVNGRENTSIQLLGMVIDLSEQMQALSDRVSSRLEPVTRTSLPVCNNKDKESRPEEEWPTLFQKLRTPLKTIQGRILDMNEVIDRLEV